MHDNLTVFYQEENLKLAIVALVREIPPLLADIKLLMTILGIGETTAIGIMSEVVDVAYFPSAKQLAKWAGLTLRVKQSGLKKKHVTGRIYKAGNRFLRRHLTSAVKSMNMIAPENKLCNILKKRDKNEPFWKDVPFSDKYSFFEFYFRATDLQKVEMLRAKVHGKYRINWQRLIAQSQGLVVKRDFLNDKMIQIYSLLCT